MEEDDVLSLSPDSYSTETIRQTRADRLRESATAPDFAPTKLQTTKDILSESVMHLTDEEREDILRSTGVYASTGTQVSTAIENALIGMNQLPDELAISFGNVANYITGGAMGQELQDIAYDSMARRYERMANREEAIGGIRSELAQLAGGATSFLQLALEGLVTSGALPLAHIGVQAFGEGTYNDMKAYADKHDGSLEGYQPEGFDLAVNAANALLQVGIEHWLGVGSPRFLTGMSRGMWMEGLGGALQEGVQGALADLAEAVKGNEEIGILLDNADQYARDAIIGGLLQGAMGAATYHHNYAKAANNIASAIAKAHGHETPTAEEQQQAEAIVDAKERQLGSVLTTEFKAAFDASTGEGKLQANIAKALNDAVAAQELDLGIDDETERAQRIEQIATQETLNAMDMAREQNRSISEMGMNNIVYRDGAIWLEGMTPEVGQRAVDYARVLAERQTGLAEVQMKLDNINAEIKQTKAELAEAKAQSKEAFIDKLQARLDKQNALAEKRKVQAEQLKAQTEKIQRQIAKELEKAPKQAETKVEEVKAVEEPKKTEAQVEMPESKVEVPETKVESAPAKEEPKAEPKPLAKIAEKTKKYKGEKKSLKQEREAGKRAKTPKEQEAQLTEVYDRITAKMEEVTKKTLDEKVSDKERAQAEKTSAHKQKGDVYVAIMPQIDEVTRRYVLKYRNYARETRPSTNFGKFGGEFTEGSTGWGKYEIFDTKEELQKAVDGLIEEYGEEYSFFDMQFVDNELKSMAEGHQQEKPEVLNYRNQELRDLEQQGFEEQYKIRTGKDYQRDRTPLKTFSDYERGKAETELKRQDKERRIGEEDWGGKTPSEVATVKIGEVFEGLKKDYADVEKQGYITDKDSVAYGHDLDAGAKQFLNQNLISYMLMKYNFDPRVVEWVKENPDLLRNNYDQKTSWNYSSESDLVDVLGTEQDYAPEGFVREDDEGVTDDNYDYEMVVYKMPQTQEEFERKVAETIVKQATTALELEDSDAKTFVENDDRTPYLFQSKVEGTGSDTKRGGYDDRLKRIILKDDADLTTIQHEFAHYWIQNNFKWARSGLASAEWLSRWRGVEEALGIEPQDRYLSKQASERFARAYERYIMEGKVVEDLQWAFDGFQKFYQDTYEDLESEYFDLSEELDPAIVDWFNRQRPVTEQALKEKAYQKVAMTAMAQGVEVAQKVNDDTYTVSSMDKNGEIKTEVVVSDAVTKDSKLVEYSGKKKERSMVKGLQQVNKDINPDMYKAVNNAATVENATRWVETDYAGAWNALNDPSTALIDRTALYQAFKGYAENGHPEVAVDLAQIKLTKEMTELGQAMSILSERAEFDPMNIMDLAQKALGEPKAEDAAEEITGMHVEQEQNVMTEAQTNELKNQTECKL